MRLLNFTVQKCSHIVQKECTIYNGFSIYDEVSALHINFSFILLLYISKGRVQSFIRKFLNFTVNKHPIKKLTHYWGSDLLVYPIRRGLLGFLFSRLHSRLTFALRVQTAETKPDFKEKTPARLFSNISMYWVCFCNEIRYGRQCFNYTANYTSFKGRISTANDHFYATGITFKSRSKIVFTI